MPLPEDCTVYLRVWTSQCCLACASNFHYLRRFVVQRRDLYADATLQFVEAEYRRHAEEFSESCPCPHCGWLQPDMVGVVKSSRHFTVNLIGFLVLLACMIATGIGLLPRELGCLISAGEAAIVGLLQTTVSLYDPNRRCERHRRRAQRLVENGSLHLALSGGDFVNPFIAWSRAHFAIACACFAGSTLALLSPAFMDGPVWVGQIPGVVLYFIGGSQFANLAYAMRSRALPHKVLSLESTVVTDETVPADFQK